MILEKLKLEDLKILNKTPSEKKRENDAVIAAVIKRLQEQMKTGL